MDKKFKTLEKLELPADLLSKEILKGEQRRMSRMHIILCLVTALVITSLHFFLRPLSLTGIFDDLQWVSLVAIIPPVLFILMSQGVYKRKINQTRMGALTQKEASALKVVHWGNWSLLTAATIFPAFFYFILNAGSVAAVLSLLSLLLLYSSKPNYEI